MPRLTRRTNDGRAILACCPFEDGCEPKSQYVCDYCTDCRNVRDSDIKAAFEKLCRYEETGLDFPKEDEK